MCFICNLDILTFLLEDNTRMLAAQVLSLSCPNLDGGYMYVVHPNSAEPSRLRQVQVRLAHAFRSADVHTSAQLAMQLQGTA